MQAGPWSSLHVGRQSRLRKALVLESDRPGFAASFCFSKPWGPSVNFVSKPRLSKVICKRGITTSAPLGCCEISRNHMCNKTQSLLPPELWAATCLAFPPLGEPNLIFLFSLSPTSWFVRYRISSLTAQGGNLSRPAEALDDQKLSCFQKLL